MPPPRELNLILNDLHKALSCALDSLGGKRANDLVESYLVTASKAIFDYASGFISLKDINAAASRAIIRPSLEAFFKIRAVQKNPETLYRITHQDNTQMCKWLNSLSEDTVSESAAKIESDWSYFKSEYRSRYAHHSYDESKLSTYELSVIADSEDGYNGFYRLYSKYTHASFFTMSGYLDFLGKYDLRAVSICIIGAIEALEECGAEIGEAELFKQEFFSAI